MGGVDCGDQLCAYYSCRTKKTKFYKYLFDVAATNAFILMKHYCPSCPFANIKVSAFSWQRNWWVLQSSQACSWSDCHPLPYYHFPITMVDKKEHKKYGRCALHAASNTCVTSTWCCRWCRVWLCHNGNPGSDFHEVVCTPSYLNFTLWLTFTLFHPFYFFICYTTHTHTNKRKELLGSQAEELDGYLFS